MKLRFSFKYDISLSFAEEDREFVQCVHEQLKQKGLKVYYYNDQQAGLLGKNLYKHLDNVFRKKSRYCAIFISKHYERKYWTQYELRAALSRALTENREYILPVRIDDTKIQGIEDSVVYFPADKKDCKELAAAIVQKVIAERTRFRAVLLWISILLVGAALFEFRQELTPVEMLARQLHEKSKRTITAQCKDSKFSYSEERRGTCSGHIGVARHMDSTVYNKTIDQCRKEAAKISWISP